jgi:carbamoyltransferase
MTYHLGINLGHERSVAIVKDGEIVVAIEQERIDRQKYSPGYMLHSPGNGSQIQLPHEAIRYAIDTIGITMGELSTITGNMPGIDEAPNILRRVLSPELVGKVQKLPSHHLAHAYSAYYPSGFDRAIVLVADASGQTIDRRTESYTLFEGDGERLTTLHSETVAAHLAGLSTLGFLYEYVTRKAGFVSQIGDKVRHAESGKLMGLAPFGQVQPHFHRWVQTMKDDFGLKICAYDIFLEIAALEKLYDKGEGKAYLRPYLVDLAYKVQQELEQALLHLVSVAVDRTGMRKLCIAGGVGLNSVANYQLLQRLKLDDIFIFPAAGDSGIAAGCALWAYHQIEGGTKRPILTSGSLGRTYSSDEVRLAISQFAGDIVVEELNSAETIERTAKSLAQGNVVARFEGGAEYGPRALGHRSIIADPTFGRMKDIINARVKFREAFRPFAPVIPLESIGLVFEQQVAAPFMLVVPKIRAEYHTVIPGVTHVDGTGRVQTVTAAANPFFHQLCHQLVAQRQGPPVLLNTSFNIAGQPIVETPAEAIATFLDTDIDYLAIENFWIGKRHVPVLDYDAHVAKISDDCILPTGLPAEVPAVTDLMATLDRALFNGDTNDCPWSAAELQELSAAGAVYKETSQLFPTVPGIDRFGTQLAPEVVLLPDPLGRSAIVDLNGKIKPTTYNWSEVQLLLTALGGKSAELERLRQTRQLTPHELKRDLTWVQQQLDRYQLTPRQPITATTFADTDLTTIARTFAPFENPDFSARQILQQLADCLHRWEYTDANIAKLLGVTSQQQIEPTRLHYDDRYRLPHNHLGDLIRLFHLQVAFPLAHLQQLFGAKLVAALINLGLLISRGADWAARVNLFEAAGLYIATDRRYMLGEEDRIDEDPVMYLGMDSMGLVYTAPRHLVDRVLDLCTGSGVQALTASRYAREVVGVDINPRAIRFARFNAQLNGIENASFQLGNLYEAVSGKFDTILANPPFVPSPSQEYRFRDGGASGEEILAQIISGSADRLSPDGRLFIVTDLVDLAKYQAKLKQWWQGGKADTLILHTADRDEILFSVPHAHAPFGQSIAEYQTELDLWVENFRAAKLTAVNFGYILIQRTASPRRSTTYYTRTIHNPHQPIDLQVSEYFAQRDLLGKSQGGKYYLTFNPALRFRYEIDPQTGSQQIELFAPDHLYFTTYPIGQQVAQQLQQIIATQPQCSDYVNPHNREIVYDLICKGILLLQPTQSTTVANLHLPFNSTNLNRGNAPSPTTESPAATELTISELQTKTTPTCLSSYLR